MVADAIARQKGLVRAGDLAAIDAPRIVLTRLTAAGLLDRVGRGLYRLPGQPGPAGEGLAAIATKAPQAVFCLLTALHFRQRATHPPRQKWIAMPRGSHLLRIDRLPIRMVQMTAEVYMAGLDEHLRDGARLRVHGAAKTVVDCFKHRNKIGLDVATEAFKEARANQQAAAEDLGLYAKLRRVANVMHPYPGVVERTTSLPPRAPVRPRSSAPDAVLPSGSPYAHALHGGTPACSRWGGGARVPRP